MLVGMWRNNYPRAPTQLTRREERRNVACRNGVWLALTERGTSDALAGVDANRNGWSPESLPGKALAMRKSNGSDIDSYC